MVDFQVSWSRTTPGKTHVSFSGDRTPCNDGLPVIEAKPVYASKLKDVDCHVCGAYVLFDMEAARKAAEEYLSGHAGTATWGGLDRIAFAGNVADRVAEVAFSIQREYGRWGSNHAFSEFMARGGVMADESSEARLIGMTAITVLDALKEREAK
jgi:hypothetical protein